MPNYRRYRVAGGCYFFTANLLERYPNDLLACHVDLLRETVRRVRHAHPFHVDVWAVLPDHLLCVWTLPPGDDNISIRWRLIKILFAKQLPKQEWLSPVRREGGAASGSGASGSMPSAMSGVLARTWITFITTRSNTGMWSEGFIRRIGEALAPTTWSLGNVEA